MAARTVPSDYAAAAQAFYVAGRAAFRAGEPRTDVTSASNPSNAAAWLQTFRTDPALTAVDLARQYGPVDRHYFDGWDDAQVGWPDRGYNYSQHSSVINRPVGWDGTDATRNRLFWLAHHYQMGWNKQALGEAAAWKRENFPNGTHPNQVSQDDAWWEFSQGVSDRKAMIDPPLTGYKDLPVAAAAPAAAASGSSDGAPYPGFNTDAANRYNPSRLIIPGGMGYGDALGFGFYGNGRNSSNRRRRKGRH